MPLAKFYIFFDRKTELTTQPRDRFYCYLSICIAISVFSNVAGIIFMYWFVGLSFNRVFPFETLSQCTKDYMNTFGIAEISIKSISLLLSVATAFVIWYKRHKMEGMLNVIHVKKNSTLCERLLEFFLDFSQLLTIFLSPDPLKS